MRWPRRSRKTCVNCGQHHDHPTNTTAHDLAAAVRVAPGYDIIPMAEHAGHTLKWHITPPDRAEVVCCCGERFRAQIRGTA